jgi:aspartate carbamoyltransferase regulatory subunit
MWIPKIREGVVIDHIPSGVGSSVLDMIRSYPRMRDVVITVALNCQSNKLGRKDLIKLDVAELPPGLLQRIALVAPGVTIKRISNYAVDKKYVNEPPEQLDNLVKCRNPNCISNNERHARTSFGRVGASGTTFKCNFCERVFDLADLELLRP